MVPVGLSLFHLAQRGTREEHLVFREPSHSTLQWGFGSFDLGIGDRFKDCQILFCAVFGPALGSTQPPNQQLSGAVALGS